MAGLAGDLSEERGLEYEVRAEHAQVPVRGMIIKERHLGHDGVEGDRARVIRDDEGARVVRDVLEAGGLDPEPGSVQRTDKGHEDVLGEVRVEAELVDLVVAASTPLDELPGLFGEGSKVIGQGGELGWERPLLLLASRCGRWLGPGIADEARGLRRRKPAAVADWDDLGIRQRRSSPRHEPGTRRRQRACCTPG